MRTRWALTAGTAAMCGVFAGPAGLASAQESAQDTIDRLQGQGITVNIDRIGSAPLTECVVTNVRNSRAINSFNPIDRIGLDDDVTVFNPVTVGRSVSVTVNCAG